MQQKSKHKKQNGDHVLSDIFQFCGWKVHGFSFYSQIIYQMYLLKHDQSIMNCYEYDILTCCMISEIIIHPMIFMALNQSQKINKHTHSVFYSLCVWPRFIQGQEALKGLAVRFRKSYGTAVHWPMRGQYQRHTLTNNDLILLISCSHLLVIYKHVKCLWDGTRSVKHSKYWLIVYRIRK